MSREVHVQFYERLGVRSPLPTHLIVHCVSKKQAEYILNKIRERLTHCKLELNEEKTCIVYCKQSGRDENYPKVRFDFLGYSFKPRAFINRKTRKKFLGFDAGISTESQKKMVQAVKEKEKSMNVCKNLGEVANVLNPSIRGWLFYYGHIRKSEMWRVISVIEHRIVKWLKRKYKSVRRQKRGAYSLLQRVRKVKPKLFAHWP